MEDIAGGSDYLGVIGLIVLRVVVVAVTIWAGLQRIQFVGGTSVIGAVFWSIFSSILVLLVILSGVVLAVFWLVKSLLVQYFCDSGSHWSFGQATAITGYAYIADLVVSILSVPIVWALTPTITIDMTNQQTLSQSIAAAQSQISNARWLFSLPLTVVGLVWKSYLGGLGANFATNDACSKRKGFAVFFILALIAVLISVVPSLRFY